MKKYIAFLLALTLAVSMTACKDGSNGTTPTATTTTTEPTGEITGTTITSPSYTGTDEEVIAARNNIVATVADAELTNGVLQLYYWMDVYNFLNTYGSYLSMYGLDYSKPLDEQSFNDTEDSWQFYFLEDALGVYHSYQALALAGKAINLEMPEDLQADLDTLVETMEKSAEESGYDSVDAMIQSDAGAGCTGDDYYTYTKTYYEGYAYFLHMSEQISFTDEEIEAYFTENEEALAKEEITKDSGNIYGVRHILLEPENGVEDEDGNKTYSEEAWADCLKEAQDLMEEWAGGTATEETFSHYAEAYSEDPGSNTNGGLYENLDADTNFVEPFKEWYLDESRQVGDYGLVKSDYGYHIMYMSSIEEEWYAYCSDILTDNATAEFVNKAMETYKLEINYDNIVLGYVSLVEES